MRTETEMKATSPLRKIVGTTDEENRFGRFIEREVLECGHLHPAPFKGEYFARSRRCAKCANGSPADVDLTQMVNGRGQVFSGLA